MLRSSVLGIAIAFAFALAGPVHAAEPCNYKDAMGDAATKSALADCVHMKDVEIEQQASTINDLKKALGNIWLIVRDPTAIIGLANLDRLHEEGELGLHFGGIYRHLATSINPDAQDDSHLFGVLRSIYSSPTALRALYDIGKVAVIKRITEASATGIVTDWLKQSQPVLKKPLNVALAAHAARWYFYECSQQTDYNKVECDELSYFAPEFETYYGVKPTPTSAWVAGYLYRRHREGGSALVTAWMDIGKDFGVALAVTPKGQ